MGLLTSMRAFCTLKQAVVVAFTCMAVVAQAADYTWDATPGSGSADDGAGTWSTSGSGTNWWDGTTNLAWPNLSTDTAVFGAGSGAAGTVTVSGGVTTNGITFNAPGSGTYTLSSGTITLAGSAPTITANVNASIGSILAGSAGLVKAGSGTLTLSSSNSYSGGTQVNAGAITLTNGSGLGAGSVSVASSGTVNVNLVTLANALTGSGRVNVNAADGGFYANVSGDLSAFTGTLQFTTTGNNGFVGILGNYLSGSNARWVVNNAGGIAYLYSGSGTTIAIGELSGNGLIGSNFNATTTWEVGALSTSSTFSGGFVNRAAGGTAGGTIFRKVGSGTLTLTGASSHTGGTQINGGVLSLGNASALSSSGSISFGGGTLQFSASNTTDYSGRFSTGTNQAYSLDTGGQNVTLASALTSSGGSLTKLGAGALTLTATNTYTGTTTISQGNLAISTTAALPGWDTAGRFSVASGAGLAVGDAVSDDAVTTLLGTGNFAADSFIGYSTTAGRLLSSPLSGSLGLVKLGSGTLTLSASNAYSGGTQVNAGFLALGNAGALGTTGTISFGGGTLQFSSSNTTDYSNRFSTAANQAFSFDTNGQNISLANPLVSSGGSLAKLGSGTLTLSGTSSFSGITVSGGALVGTTANISGAMTNNGQVFFNQDTSGTYAGAITGSGTIVKAGAGTVTLTGASVSGGAQIDGGILSIGAANAGPAGPIVINQSGTLSVASSLGPVTTGTISGNGTISLVGGSGQPAINANISGFTGTVASNPSANYTGFGANATGSPSARFVLSGSVTANAFYAAVTGTFRMGELSGTAAVRGAGGAGAVTWEIGGLNTNSTFAGGFLDSLSLAANTLRKVGSGTLALTGASSHTGGTQINVGGVALTGVGSLGSGTVAIAAGATLDVVGASVAGPVTGPGLLRATGNNPAITTVSGTLSGFSGTVQTDSSNGYVLFNRASTGSNAAWVVNGTNASYYTYTDGTNGSMGELSGNGRIGGTFNVAVSTWEIGALSTSSTYSGVFVNNIGTGATQVRKVGSGTLTLTGNSSYSGGTQLNAGAIAFGSTTALGTGPVTLGGGVLQSAVMGTIANAMSIGAVVSGTFDSQSNTNTLSGVISGSGTLVKTGAGTLTLSNANSYSGGTRIDAGAITASNVNAFGSGTVAIGGSGTAVLAAYGTNFTTAVTGSGVLNLNSGAAANQSTIVNFAGDLSGFTGSVVVTSGGDFVGIGGNYLTGSNAKWVVNNATGSFYLYAGSGTTVAMGELSGNGRIGSNYLTDTTWEVGALSTSSTFSGVIVNAVAPNTGRAILRKVGSGTLTLTGSSAYSGGTQLNAGAIALGNTTALGTGTVTFGGGVLQSAVTGTIANAMAIGAGVSGTFDSQSNTNTLSGAISGSGTLVKTGAGTLTLSNVNSYSGGTQVSDGAIAFASTTGLGTGTVTLGGGVLRSAVAGTLTNRIAIAVASGTFDSQANANTLSGTITGAGEFVKIGSGTLSLSGVNSHSGGTRVDEGTVVGQTLSAFGSGTIAIGASGIARLAMASAANTAGFTNAVTGSGVLLVTSDVSNSVGIVNYSGDLSGFTGTVRLTSLGAFVGFTGNTLTGSNARWEVNNSTGSTYLYTASGTTVAMGELSGNGRIGSNFIANTTWEIGALATSSTFSGVFVDATTFGGTGRAVLRKVGAGALTLTGSSSYTGGTQLNAGVIALGNADALGASGTISFGGGTLQFSGSNTTNYASRILSSGSAVRLDTNGQNVAFGALGSSNTGGLAKLGGGTLTMTGASSYSGVTSVQAGSLLVNGSLASSSAVTVASGATLGGSGSIAGAITGDGLVSPGNSPGILTAAQFDPSGGLDAAFELTAFSPIYTSATASLNDITRLTNLTDPFASGSFTSANVIDVYFNVDSIANGEVYEGGFFTGLSAASLLAALDGTATFAYWAKTTGTPTRTFGGVDYVALGSLPGITGITFQTAARTADFGSGPVTGSVTQFVIVPEPAALALAGIGVAIAVWASRRQR